MASNNQVQTQQQQRLAVQEPSAHYKFSKALTTYTLTQPNWNDGTIGNINELDNNPNPLTSYNSIRMNAIGLKFGTLDSTNELENNLKPLTSYNLI